MENWTADALSGRRANEPITAMHFIIGMVQFHFPEWLEVNFTFHIMQNEPTTSAPNNSDKNVNVEAGNLYSRYP
jgi:hypothetical protein